MKFSVASFHNVGSFTFTADDGCWFPLFVEGVVDVNRVTRLEGLCVVVCVTIVVGGLLLLAVKVGLAMEVCLRVMRRQREICRRHKGSGLSAKQKFVRRRRFAVEGGDAINPKCGRFGLLFISSFPPQVFHSSNGSFSDTVCLVVIRRAEHKVDV